jgi:hypothetical protein
VDGAEGFGWFRERLGIADSIGSVWGGFSDHRKYLLGKRIPQVIIIPNPDDRSTDLVDQQLLAT